MQLAIWLFQAMVAWVPINQHAYYETTETTETRYRQIAEDIAAVAEDPDTVPIFAGADGRPKTALLITSIASSESHFHADVDSCKKGGDGDKAWGLLQTQRPKFLVCASRRAAIRIGLDMARDSFRACAHATLEERLALYTDGPRAFSTGRCADVKGRSRVKVGRALAWWRHSPFTVDSN